MLRSELITDAELLIDVGTATRSVVHGFVGAPRCTRWWRSRRSDERCRSRRRCRHCRRRNVGRTVDHLASDEYTERLRNYSFPFEFFDLGVRFDHLDHSLGFFTVRRVQRFFSGDLSLECAPGFVHHVLIAVHVKIETSEAKDHQSNTAHKSYEPSESECAQCNADHRRF